MILLYYVISMTDIIPNKPNTIETGNTLKTGILHTFNTKTGEWCILSDGWERFVFKDDLAQLIEDSTWKNRFSTCLSKGDKVSFVRGEGAEYDVAKKVGLISHTDIPQVVENFSTQTREFLDVIVWPQIWGRIKTMKNRIDEDSGFWFIIPDDGGKDVFFHSDSCKGGFEEFKTFGINMRLVFNVQESPKGRIARNVTIDTSLGKTE